MIEIADKSSCCGCGACAQRCPKQCITMREDSEGFLYPCVEETDCIGCGLCDAVCPCQRGIVNKREPQAVYAAKNPNEEARNESSSGGMFTMLAEKVIDEGGVVFGASFDDDWAVTHSYVERKKDLYKLRGSKYVQSNIKMAYEEVEQFLKADRVVMFTGTSCQMSGLTQFLRKDYAKLYKVDVICHGVPSPAVFREYIKEKMVAMLREENVGSTCMGKSRITKIAFRDKRCGWKNFGFELAFDCDVHGIEKEFSCYETKSENLFMRGFLNNIYLRPSCYKCQFKNLCDSDLTLGDYWGISTLNAEMDDDKGVSAITVNTEKGRHLLSTVLDETLLYKTTSEDLFLRNPALFESVAEPKNRKDFFETGQKSVSRRIEKLLREDPIYKRAMGRLISIFKK